MTVEEWDLFKKKWFEVSIVHLADILTPAATCTDGGSYSNASSFASSYINNSPYYNNYMQQREKSGSSMLIKGCGLLGVVFKNFLKINYQKWL